MKVKEFQIKLKNNPLINDSFWAVFGNVIGKGFSFAGGIAIARLLGKEGFGEYSFITSTLISSSILSTLGIGYTSTKYISEYKQKNRDIIFEIIRTSKKITLFGSGLLSLILFFLSNYIATHFLNSESLHWELKILSVWVVLNALTTTQIGILAGFGLFKEMTKINTLVGVISFITSLSFAYLFGLRGALASLLLIQTINWYLNNKLVKQQGYNYVNKNENGIATEMIKFSIPIALQESLYAIVTWFLSWSFIRFSTVGELGVYQAAVQMSILLLFVPGILRNVFLTHFSEASGDQLLGKRVLRITLLINGISVFIPLIFVLIFIDPINRFYGDQFGDIKYLIVFSCITAIFTSLLNVYNQALLSSGENWIIFWSRFIRDGILILCFIILVQKGYAASSVLVTLNLIFSTIYFFVLLLFYKKLNPGFRG